jgi:asparagine synthase (glutamine-hydrolysing)
VKALQRVLAHATFGEATAISNATVNGPAFSARVLAELSGKKDCLKAGGIDLIVLGEACDAQYKPLRTTEVLARYQGNGQDFAKQLTGAYAYILHDRDAGVLLAGVDRMARLPLAFVAVGHGVAVATSTEELSVIRGVALTLDPQALYDYVYFHMIAAPRTLYKGVQRLAPGQQLIAKSAQIAVRHVWQPEFVEDRPVGFEEAKRAFRGALEASVRDACVGASNVGTFLSGGTDSSTMTGLVAQVTGKPAKAYSIGFDEPRYDETGYAKIAAAHFPTDHHIYFVTPQDAVDALPKVVAAYDQPFGNASAIPTYYCALRAQEDGISHMVAGDGGDELFGGNDRYAFQARLSQWSDLPAALRAPARGAASLVSGMGPLAKLKRGIAVAEMPMPARLQHYNVVNQIGNSAMFSPDFLRMVNVNAPLELQHAIYHAPTDASQLNRLLALDWRITLSDSDLPKVTSMCAQAGMPVFYPMLDDRVTDMSLSLPPNMKLKGQALRWFFKEALRDFLPEAILLKPKHGFGLPFGHWLGKHAVLRDQAMSALDALKKRDVIRPEFIDTLKAARADEGGGYLGTMVWVLMMLELWLDHHRPASSASQP